MPLAVTISREVEILLLRFFAEVGVSIHKMVIFYSYPIHDAERGNISSFIAVILDVLNGAKKFLIAGSIQYCH